MFLTIRGPLGHEEQQSLDNAGLSLGVLLADSTPHTVKINGRLSIDWPEFVPERGDRIEIEYGSADFGISAAIAGSLGFAAGSTGAAVVSTVVNAIIALVISASLSGITRALTPKPKTPKLDSSGEAFGIAGFRNTTGRGTPAFVPYGVNRIWGHVISSGAVLSPDGKQMWGKILYFMGDAGGDGIDGIWDVRIDGTSVSQYPDITVSTRLGLDVQPVIPEFENRDKLYSPPVQALDFDPATRTGTPVVYTTVGDDIDKATLFINFPGGLYRITDGGKQRMAGVQHKLEIKLNSDSTWVEQPFPLWSEYKTSGIFKTWDIYFPSAGKWDIRLTVIDWVGWKFDEAFVGGTILFNVQETAFTTKTYPGWALLGLTNIPSKQIQSLESMSVSAMVYGKRVKIPDGQGNSTLTYTRQRCWIVRDMMTHPVIGMGSEIAESEIEDAQWIESQGYYDEMVAGHNGLEERDFCDFVLNDSDWDWEWVKKVAGEARGRIIPSGIKWKYIIDRPIGGTHQVNLLYTEGANVIDGSVNSEIAPPDKPFSEISGQFRDADKDYEQNFSPPIVDPEAVSVVQELQSFDTIIRESEVQRENMITFKRNFLERRRWAFLSPQGAIVSEVGELDYFAERGIGNEGAYGGILGPGSTVFTVYLPDIVTMQVGATYALIVKHYSDNTTEYRIVSYQPGTWGSVIVTAPFLTAPVEGDAFSLGIQDVEHIPTRAQELEIDKDGRVRQVRTEYVPAVYTQDPLPPKSSRKYFNLQDKRLPIPLREANVSEEVAMNRDGSVRSILIFDITPGLSVHSGQAGMGSTVDAIVLGISEPDRDDYFNDAAISIIAGTGFGQIGVITDYVGFYRAAYCHFDVIPGIDSVYVVQWNQFAETGGFRVEISDDGINFSNLATVYDTHYEMDGRGTGPGLVYFRFTPFSNNGAENVVARIVKSILIQGDLSAPLQPVAVTISSYLLTASVLVYLQRPIAEDFAGVEIQIWRNEIGGATGVLLEETRFGAPSDSGTVPGTMRIEATFNLGARFPPEVYGTTVWARALSIDHSQNKSFYTTAPFPTVLTYDAASAGIGVGPPAVPTGLALYTETQVDPYDGAIKPYLLITWFANTEPDMSRYEVQYRLVADGPGVGPLTARVVSHPQISLKEFGVIAGVGYQVRIQAIDTTNNVSGFTSWYDLNAQIIIAHDYTAPPPPQLLAILGGFEMFSLYFSPPNVQDFAFVEAWIAPVNDISQSYRIERSAPDSISIRVAGLSAGGLDFFTLYVWLRAFDTSGNVSAFDRTPFDGWPVNIHKITGNDVAQFSGAVITGTAQIANAIITDAHIQTLAADKITTGNLKVVFRIGVGGNVYIDGLNSLFVVYDLIPQVRVQMGKLGPGAQDYGLQIFGPDGSLWHSFTSGTQTLGLAPYSVSSGAVEYVNEGEVFHDHSSSGFLDLDLLSTLTFSTTGGPVYVFGRVKFESANVGSRTVEVYLYRDGISIDHLIEKTNQGKHLNVAKIDQPAAGVHSYEFYIRDASGSAPNQYNTTFLRLQAVEIKR